MRCPKCGYISFDHLETCNKCSKDLTDVVEKFGGGLVRADAPHFLVMTPPSATSFGADSLQGAGQDFDEEFLDEDLNVLLAEDDDEPMISLSDEDVVDGDLDGSVDFDFSFDSDEEGGDENVISTEDDEDDSPLLLDDEFTLSVPTELSDMSDLAQKQSDDDEEGDDFVFSLEDEADELPALATDEDTNDFDLEELNLELDSVLSEPGVSLTNDDFELSLNDIDFSEMGPSGGAPALNPDGSVDMDVDLDFELDLGGLSLHKKEEKV